MEILVLVLVLHVVVVVGFIAGRALHARIGPIVVTAPDPGTAMGVAPVDPLAGRTLEEYVRAGLVDLQIMLVQAARRRHD